MDRESVVCGLVVAPRGRSHTAGGVLTRNAASSKSPLWDKANGVTWPGLWIDCLLWSLVPVGPAGRIGDSHMHCGGIRGELRSWPSYTLSSPCAAFLLYSLCTVELVASCLRGGCTDDLPIPAQRIFLDKTMLLPHTGKCVCPCYITLPCRRPEGPHSSHNSVRHRTPKCSLDPSLSSCPRRKGGGENVGKKGSAVVIPECR